MIIHNYKELKANADNLASQCGTSGLQYYDWRLYNNEISFKNLNLINNRYHIDTIMMINDEKIKTILIKNLNQEIDNNKHHDNSSLQALMYNIFAKFPIEYSKKVRYNLMVQLKLIQLQIKPNHEVYNDDVYENAFEYACRLFMDSNHETDDGLDGINQAIHEAKLIYKKGLLISD